MKKKVSESIVETSQIVLPSHANALGTIFGGTIMSWIDIAGAICAQRHSQRICVTASVDTLNFLAPVHVGDTVYIKAKIVYAGTSSMMINVLVSAQNVEEQDCRKCVDAYLTFVALDKNRKPMRIPSLELETDEERKEYEAAQKRRKNILEQRELLK